FTTLVILIQLYTRLSFCSFTLLTVPILPSYLYRTFQATSTTSGNNTETTVSPPLIHSLSNQSGILGSTFAPPNQNPAFSIDPTKTSPDCSGAGAQLDEVNIKVGLLLASKSTIQIITNPFIGPLTDRWVALICGKWADIFNLCPCLSEVFAFSSSYMLLLLARSVQGVGGSCLSVEWVFWLICTKDREERGRAMAISFTGLALGLIAGAPFGSVMYEFVGKMAPFLVLAVIAVLGGGTMEKGTPLLTLLKDPYILIAAGAICLTTLVVATIETALPIWMMKTMCASKWQLVPFFFFFFFGECSSILFFMVLVPNIPKPPYKYCTVYTMLLSSSHSWLCACIGMILAGITTISVTTPNTVYIFCIVDSSIMPLMGFLVDLRYVPVYGTIYAIADVAICIGFCVGPAIAGPIVASIGFPWLMVIIGTVNIIFAPLCIFLLRLSRQDEHLVRALLSMCHSTLQYLYLLTVV
uniref:Major facilitator superfamily (MFS) profile domain-containing protein n=1 Tax=Dicentrarchus labrax TaxID=13489 RepID=A0A8C4NYI8_DICLA